MPEDQVQQVQSVQKVQPVTDLKTRYIDMAFQSGPTVAVLLMVLAWVATQVPVHLEAIKAGYKEVIANAKADRDEADKRHADTIRDLSLTFSKEQERTERLFQNRAGFGLHGDRPLAAKPE